MTSITESSVCGEIFEPRTPQIATVRPSTRSGRTGWLQWLLRGSTPEALRGLLVSEMGKWKKVIENAKIEKQ